MNIARPALEAWFSEAPAWIHHDLSGTMVPADMARFRRLLDTDHWDTRYSPTAGTPGLRQRIAASEGVDPEDLVLACGATEAAVAALLATCRPHTAAIVQDPVYYLFEPWLRTLGIAIRPWPARPEGTWHAEDVASLLDSEVSLIVVNSPHNPTGRTIVLEDLARLVEPLTDVAILVDEVYRGVVDDGLDCAALVSDRILAVNSASKRWGLPGLRLGWVACRDARLRHNVLSWHEHLAHSPPRPSEEALLALWSEIQAEVPTSRIIGARNRTIVDHWLARHPDRLVGCLPDAGVTMLIKFHGQNDDLSFAQLARESGVFVVPGSCLGYPGRVRIGFGHRDATALGDALAALAALAG